MPAERLKHMDVKSVLFALLRSEICGEAVHEEVKTALCPELLEELCEVSNRHSLARLMGQALSKLGALGEDDSSLKFQQSAMSAVARNIQRCNV